MSDDLRDILGIGSKKMPLMSVPLAKSLTAAANEGANKGFWRIQLRDQHGNWVQMGGAVTFEVDLPDLGKVFGTGTYQGYSKENPNEIIVRVKDHPKLPDGDYSIPPDNLEESAEAIIPAEALARLVKKDEGVSIEQMEAEAAQAEQVAPALKDEITGDEAMQVIRNAGAEYAKSQGRFPMSRTYDDIKQGLRSQYSQLLEGIKQDNPELLKNQFIINEDGTGRTADIETEEDFWGALTAMQVSTTSRWVSPDNINPLAKEVNRRYAEKFLGVKKDGLISFYRNSIQEKDIPAEAAAGYISLDKKMAWDYNPTPRPGDVTRGRYIVKAKPDEVLGILGYSGAVDEFGLVISPEVTSLPGRFERVGDLEKQTIDTAPWVEMKLLDEWSRTGGGGPFRFLAPMTNFDYYALDSNPFGEENTWASFIKTNNLPDKSVSQKYDEIYGAGFWEKDWKGSNPTARVYADLFVKFTDKDGKEKWGLNAPNLRNLSTTDMLNFAEPGDEFDRGIKLLSTMQELLGKPFFVNKGHSKEDPRVVEAEKSGESTPGGEVEFFDEEQPAQATSDIPYSADSARARYLDPKNGGVFKLGDTIPVTDYYGNVTQHVVDEKDISYDTSSRIVSEPESSIPANPLVKYSRIPEGTPAHDFMSKWYEKNKGKFLHYNYRPLERLIAKDASDNFGTYPDEGISRYNYETGIKQSIYRHIRFNRLALHSEMFKEMAKTLPESEWPKGLDIFVEYQKNIKALSEALPEARISISIDGKDFLKVIADGRFKSQFETKTSGGIYDRTSRTRTELGTMGVPINLDPEKRPIYGNLVLPDLGRFDAIDMEQDTFKVTSLNTWGYGIVKVILKPETKRKATYTAEDSLTFGADSARPLTEKFTEESLLLSGISRYESALPQVSGIKSDYFEVQVHNGVSLDDIDKIIVTDGAQQTFSEISKALKDSGLSIPIQLVDDERKINLSSDSSSEQSGVEVPGGDVEFFDDEESEGSKIIDTAIESGDIDYKLLPESIIESNFDRKNIPKEQDAALFAYSMSTFLDINAYLRNDEVSILSTKQYLDDHIKNLDALIEEKGDVLEEAVVYRGTSAEKGSPNHILLDSLQEGDIVEDLAYSSTTKSPKVAFEAFGPSNQKYEGVQTKTNTPSNRGGNSSFWRITLPVGSKALAKPAGEYGHSHEKEVLLPRGSKFRINAIRKVEQVGQNGKKNGNFNYFIDATVVPDLVPEKKESEQSGVEVPGGDVEFFDDSEKQESPGLTVNGRSELRDIKRRLGGEIFDTTAIKLIEKYSGSDGDVKKLDAALNKEGLYRKGRLFSDGYVDAVRSAIFDYKKIDPNLNTERKAKRAQYGMLNGTGLGVIGYLQAGTLTRFDNFDFSYASDKNKLSAAREEIIKNGFIDPIILLYNPDRDEFSLENPEDSLKILATREIKDPDIKVRAIPTVVKVSAESDSFDKDTELNPVFFYELSQPSAWIADIQVKPEEYYDLSGIDSLPVPSRTDAEKEAIDFYQRGTYLTLKKYLADPSSAGDDAEKLGKIVDTLNKLGNSEKLPANTELFRGFRLSADSDLYKYYSSLKSGDVLADPNRFGSTSLDPIVAEDFATLGGKKDDYTGSVILEISTEEGATGVVFGDNKDTYASGVEVVLASEKEVLLPFGAELKIDKLFKDSDGILRIRAKYGKKVELESKSDAADQDFIDFSSFEKVSGRLGHTDGGKYKDPKTGKEYYVKIQDGKRGANEALASALYNEAGIDSIRVKNGVLDDTPITYTEWRDDLTPISERISKITSDDPALDGFAIDAWLANWDTVGAGDFGGYNNISYDKDGNPVRIDAGGALLYRGAGSRKGSTFGNEVGELETFKNTNFTTGELFSKITNETELASVDKLRKITPERIDELVDQYVSDLDDNKELKDKLKARREFILSKYEPTSEAEQSGESDAFDEVEWFDDIEQPAPTSKVLDSLLKDGFVNLDAAPDSTILSNFTKDEIPLEQKNALFYYLGPQYRSFNNFLRFGNQDGFDKVPDIEQKIKDLDALIESKGNVETESFVYRGMVELPKFEDTDITMSEMLDGLKPGDVISDPAFLSTSSDKNIALRKFGPGVMTDNGPTLDASNPVYEPSSFWAIRVPKGSKALAAPEDSYFSEKEVLLPRNTQLRIDGIKKVAQVEEGGENGSFNYYIEASVIPVSNVSEPLDPPRIDVPEKHRWKVESNFGVDDYYNKVAEKIHSELGYYVSNLPFSKEYNMLEGETFAKKNTKIKKVKGLVGKNNCWQNVAEAIRQGWDGDVYLGFSADEGASRGSGHAWLVKDGEVLETTHLAREVYFGKKLSEQEKKQFLAEFKSPKESEKSGGSSKDGEVEFFDDGELDPKAVAKKYQSDFKILSNFEADKELATSYDEILDIDRKRREWLEANGVTVKEIGSSKLITFTPEEIKNAYNYRPEGGIFAAVDMTDEQGREFNRRMRTLADLKKPGSISTETIEDQNRLNRKTDGDTAALIEVKELRHSAPASRFGEITDNGIRPKATNKVGGENYTRRRFGVFLANGYTSSEAGERADVFRVKVPESDLRVDAGYTKYGSNLYVERTIKPEELEHIGHYPVGGDENLHPGRGAECKDCDLAEKKRQEAEQKREEEKKERYSTPVAIYQLKYEDGKLADYHAVHYKSGENEMHTGHSVEDCPEAVKNPNVTLRPKGIGENETLAEIVAKAEKASISEKSGNKSSDGEVEFFDDSEPTPVKIEDLSADEGYSLEFYSRGLDETSRKVNTFLQMDRVFDRDALEYDFLDEDSGKDVVKTESELNSIVDNINNAIYKHGKLDNPTTLYRGVGENVEGMLENLSVGDIISEPGFSSTALDPKIARQFSDDPGRNGVLFKINAPKGSYGLRLGDDLVPAFSNENGKNGMKGSEVLLPSGTKFKIVSIKKELFETPRTGKYLYSIEVDLIPQEKKIVKSVGPVMTAKVKAEKTSRLATKEEVDKMLKKADNLSVTEVTDDVIEQLLDNREKITIADIKDVLRMIKEDIAADRDFDESEKTGGESSDGEVTWFDDSEGSETPKSTTIMASEDGLTRVRPGELVKFDVNGESVPFKYTGTELADILNDPSDANSIGIFEGTYLFELSNSRDEEKMPNGFYVVYSDDIDQNPDNPDALPEFIESHNQFVGTKMPTKRSIDEQLAVDAYSSTFYRELNTALNRGEDVSKLERIERTKKFTGDQILANLDSHIDRSTLSEDTTLWRGITTRDPKYKSFLESLQPGDIIKDNSFTSTSRDRGMAGLFLETGTGADDLAVEFKINAKKGTKAADIFRSSLGPTNREKEVLLPRGDKMTDSLVVTKVEKDKYNSLFLRVELDYAPTSTSSKEKPAPEKKKGIKPGFKNWVGKINGLFESIDKLEEEGFTRGNATHAVFLEAAGFNGKPQVLSQAEFDALEGTTIYRGLESEDMITDYQESLVQFASEGTFGNGTYGSNLKSTALKYAAKRGDDSNNSFSNLSKRTMEMKLLPDANVMIISKDDNFSDIKMIMSKNFMDAYEKSGASREQYDDTEFRLVNDADWTNIAIMNGFDAIQFDLSFSEMKEKYTIILNRGKVAINGKS